MSHVEVEIHFWNVNNWQLICVLALVAAASAAPQYPILYPVGSPLSPVQPCSQDEFGRLIPGGFVYPGQGNMQIGSWPWGLMNPMPFYPTDPRFIVLPGPGIPITSDNSEIKPISPTVPIPGITPAESKPREWLSSTPTVASRSRCLADYRSQKPEAPRSANVIGYMVASDIATPHQYPFMVSLSFQTFSKKVKPDETIFQLNCLNYIDRCHLLISTVKPRNTS